MLLRSCLTLAFSLLINLGTVSAFAQTAAAVGQTAQQQTPEQTPTAHYAVAGSFNIPGGTQWGGLALDPMNNRLYIAHGDSVDVVDLFLKKIIGSIPANDAKNVVLAPDINRGFISNGNSTVTIFDMGTMGFIGSYGTGLAPDAIVYDPVTHMVFTANTGNNSMTAMMRDGTVFGSLRLEGRPGGAVADGQGHLYVTLKDKAQISIIDTNSLTVTAHYELPAPCQSPSGIAIDMLHGQLFTACASRVFIAVDMASGATLAALPIGAMSDTVAYDAAAHMAFTASGDGTLSVIDVSVPHNNRVSEVMRTPSGAHTMALDTTTHKIYLVAAQVEGPPPANSASSTGTTTQTAKPGTFMVIMVDPGVAAAKPPSP